MPRMSGSKAICESLKREGVKVIFGIPGGMTIPAYDALYDSDIRHILVRHEQCAAHMADGYARVSGRAGVCFGTSGPGATNLVTGIANAYMDSTPVVAMTGQVVKSVIGKDAFQEADIIGITMPITKYNFQAKNSKDIPLIMRKAFHIATTGRPGPVLIDLPRDVQLEEADMVFPEKVEIKGYRPTLEPHPLQVKKIVEALKNAERPMILAGGGVTTSNASEELVRLAEFMLAPVATTFMGKGCISEDHPLSLGIMGMHGTLASNKVVLEADLLLAVGTRFSDRTTGRIDEFAPDAKIIHIDIDPAEIGKNSKVDIPVVADARMALTAINRNLVDSAKRSDKSPWMDRVNELKNLKLSFKDEGTMKPPKLLMMLRGLLKPDTIVTTEVGQNQMWAALYFKALRPRTFISSGGLGTMGFGFPAALGAKVARPNLPVVDIAGDGSFIMTEQELATSVTENIPVIVIVLNNSMLGMVAQWQRLFYKRRYSGVKLDKVPDFVKLAEAYGAQGLRAQSYVEFEEAVKKALKSDVTTVIDVPISPEENVFPMVPPGATLKEMMLD
ncbi:MAG TPA: biosynthetic-type acetolactate synthase large subunit [Candidatus Bathyarchaeia archaeon]|nr:biosynthetic-type acetolactate synthase large subunit [Candidatus Bathyarchaeia archaeon]